MMDTGWPRNLWMTWKEIVTRFLEHDDNSKTLRTPEQHPAPTKKHTVYHEGLPLVETTNTAQLRQYNYLVNYLTYIKPFCRKGAELQQHYDDEFDDIIVQAFGDNTKGTKSRKIQIFNKNSKIS